jgi:membrane protein DedA with SNARE-associated domain
MARHETRSTLAHNALQRMLQARARALPPRPLQGWSATGERAASAWRLLPPLLGVAISLLAWTAQNVWHLFHIQDVTDGIRSLDPNGLALALFLIGAIEGTVVLCFYLPGTAVVILLFASLQPSWSEGLPLLAALGAGTLAGYGLSVALGQALAQRLPRLVGPASFARMRGYVERFGLATVAVAAFHPNPSALAFAVAGYLGVRRIGAYLAVAGVAQGAWWTLYAATASTVSRQTVVTGGNFQLVLAGLFAVWLVYELAVRWRGG